MSNISGSTEKKISMIQNMFCMDHNVLNKDPPTSMRLFVQVLQHLLSRRSSQRDTTHRRAAAPVVKRMLCDIEGSVSY